MGYTFKKSTCERYDIKFNSFGWAIITIDESGGLFNAQSDYGSYSYSWPNHGRKSFKHFILELARDRSYFLGKVSNDNHFNFDESLRQWKKALIEMRKERERTKDDIREAWDFIEEIDGSMSWDHVQHELYQSKIINKICCEPWYVFAGVLEYPPAAVMFAKEVMPIFAEILKQEIG